MVKLTIASAEKSVLMQSVVGVYTVCVWYRKGLKFRVTTLVQMLDSDLKQKNQKNEQFFYFRTSVVSVYLLYIYISHKSDTIVYLQCM